MRYANMMSFTALHENHPKRAKYFEYCRKIFTGYFINYL